MVPPQGLTPEPSPTCIFVCLGVEALISCLGLAKAGFLFSPPYCVALFCFTGTYPRPSLWPSACCSLLLGSWWCARPHLCIFVFYFVFVLFCFFTSHSV